MTITVETILAAVQARNSLPAQAARIDALDLAGRIIADARRTQVSTAGALALAGAVERYWQIALEADLLMRALEQPTPDGEAAAVRDHAIADQIGRLRALLAPLRGEETEANGQESDDGEEGQG